MCNGAHVRATKSSKGLLKKQHLSIKKIYLIQNIQVLMSIYYFKLLNICKLVHDRKTHKVIANMFKKCF